ncbi:hypothetical protein KQI84_08750 [bacterium]|nr:hypothetical protein [bacterium]
MKFTLRSILSVFALLLMVQAANAFPTWMGVYGSYERHSDANPGTYTILMNQDYYGLHAEVGVQVDGGSWESFEMAYAGNVDGNSMWTYTPAAAYPAGATVSFYFHGYDNWGGNIWDSNGGANYSFDIPAAASDFVWGTPVALPMEGNAWGGVTAVAGGTIYAAWTNPTQPYGNQGEIRFTKKTVDTSWQSSIVVSPGQYDHNVTIAAEGNVVYLVYTTDTYHTYAIRSFDGGANWGAPIELLAETGYIRGVEIEAKDGVLYAVYNDYSVPETSRIRMRTLANGSNSWSASSLVHEFSAYKTTLYMDELVIADSGNKLAVTTHMMSWYGGYTEHFYHESTNAGASWAAADYVGNAAQIAADAAGNVAFVSYNTGPAGGGLYFSERTIGGSWSTPALIWEAATISPRALQFTAQGLILVAQVDGVREIRTSADYGYTWGAAAAAGPAGSEAMWSADDVMDGGDLFLTGTIAQKTYVMAAQADEGTAVAWAGDAYNWPFNGDIDAGEDVWVNIDVYPAGAATSARVVVQVNGGDWESVPMSWSETHNSNDWWHVNLGSFNSGDSVQYAIEVIGGQEDSHWDNNGGGDFTFSVN